MRDQLVPPGPLFCAARSTPVRSHDCSIDTPQIIIQFAAICGMLGKAINDTLEGSIIIPTIEMLEHCLPCAKFGRQVSPFSTSVVYPNHRLKHLPWICRRSTCLSGLWENVFDYIPLFISQSMTHNSISCLLNITDRAKSNQDQFRNKA
jgi:hypothetical protein